MHTKFKCNHCGFCCFETGTQINITLGDIKRISEFLNISPARLFYTHIGINPFQDTATRYDYELGMNIPCHLWVKKKCKIYPARPLNCRLFPYWILANAKKEDLKKYFHKDNQCLSNFKFDEKYRIIYKKYVQKIGNFLLEESRATDAFMKDHGFASSVDIAQSREYKALQKKNSGKALDRKKIYLCQKIMNSSFYAELPRLAEMKIKEIEDDIISLSMLNKSEKILK